MDAKKFELLVDDVKNKLYPNLPADLVICGPMGDGEPIFTNEKIAFNGKKDLSHESFIIKQTFTPNSWDEPDDSDRYFNFCKTARKPYDLLAVAVLFAAKYRFGDDFTFSSDGDKEELQEGFDFWKQHCNPKDIADFVGNDDGFKLIESPATSQAPVTTTVKEN